MIYNDVPQFRSIVKLVKSVTFCVSVKTIVSGLQICEY